MDAEVIEHLCKSHAIISNSPTKLYFEHDLIQSYNPLSYILDADLAFPHMNQLFKTDKPVNYCITPDMLIMGLVKDHASPYSMVIGPMCITTSFESTARKIITSGKYNVKLEHLPQLTTYLSHVHIVHIERFLLLLSTMFTSINHQIMPVADIVNHDMEYDIEAEVERNMLEKDETTSFHGIERRSSYDYESEMMFYIKHGMTQQLKKTRSKGLMLKTGLLAFDNLRHYKNAMIILNSLSLRAAIAGGLSPETCYQLGEIYIQKIEACTDMNQLTNIGNVIRIDYCERVRELQYPHTDDTTINKAMHYINENVHKKITATEIADMLCISKEYLSTRFKKATGSSIPEYITNQKMLEAKRLLTLTDKPLAEISEYLAFSSQSNFQNTFKKSQGVTPLKYRNTPQTSKPFATSNCKSPP